MHHAVRAVVAAAATVPVFAGATSSPIDLPPDHIPPADSVVARHDGTELLLLADGRLAPDATTTYRQLYLMDVATRAVRRFATVQGDVAGEFHLDPSGGKPVASRQFDRFAFATRTTRVNEGGGGDAVWITDRNGTLELVTRAYTGGLPQMIGYTSTPAGFDVAGRYLAFWSNAPDLVPNDTNGRHDVFLYDTQTKDIARVSLNGNGEQSPAGGWFASIAPDGSAVAFVSDSQLLPQDLNNLPDLYTVDLGTRALRLISRGPAGESSNGVQTRPARWSDDGRYLAFEFAPGQPFKVEGRAARPVLFDRTTGQLRNLAVLLDEPVDKNVQPWLDTSVLQISASGRYALLSARMLPPPYGTVVVYGVFLADLHTSQVLRTDLSPVGTVLSYPTDEASLAGDSPRLIVQNRSPELGTTDATVAHDWQPPPPSRLSVIVEGPRRSIAADAPTRYTVRITNSGSAPVDDLVVRRYVSRGGAGNNEGTACSESCAFPPLAAGATLTFAFDITPERTVTDSTPGLQFDIRVQSLGSFDETPPDNRVAVTASAGGSSGGGGGGGSGGGGGGGAVDGAWAALLLLAGLVRRACVSRPLRTYLNGR